MLYYVLCVNGAGSAPYVESLLVGSIAAALCNTLELISTNASWITIVSVFLT